MAAGEAFCGRNANSHSVKDSGFCYFQLYPDIGQPQHVHRQTDKKDTRTSLSTAKALLLHATTSRRRERTIVSGGRTFSTKNCRKDHFTVKRESSVIVILIKHEFSTGHQRSSHPGHAAARWVPGGKIKQHIALVVFLSDFQPKMFRDC
jgi:hypothetical protein